MRKLLHGASIYGIHHSMHTIQRHMYAGILIIAVALALPANAWAREARDADADDEQETAMPAADAPAPAKAVSPAAREGEAKARLQNTAWDVALNPMSNPDKTKKPMHDTVQFMKDQVSSKLLQAQGFQPTHYTITVAEDGTITWETMQTSEKQGVAFWRGELQGDVMHGVFSHRLAEGQPADDYSFVGHGSQLPPSASEEIKPPQASSAPPAAAQPAATPASPQQAPSPAASPTKKPAKKTFKLW